MDSRDIFRIPLIVICLILLAPAVPFSFSTDPSPAEGLWLSDGYGLFFEIIGPEMRAYEITAISCLPAWTAQREVDKTDGVLAAFGGGFESGEDHVQLFAGSNPSTILLQRADAISTMRLTRLSARPKTCDAKVVDTPLFTYDVFWNTFAENYPSFDKHSVNWAKVNQEYRPQVAAGVTSAKLFAIFTRMLEPLHDQHVLIQEFPPNTSLKKAWLKTAIRSFQGSKEMKQTLTDDEAAAVDRIIRAKYVSGTMIERCNGRLQFGIIDKNIGYLKIASFHGYTSEDDFNAGLVELKSAADKIFAQARSVSQLIIDVRQNSGGDDPNGFIIAEHLTEKRYMAWAKRVRNDPQRTSSFPDPVPFFIKPSNGPIYSGKVVLLMGNSTASAAEVFVMSLMGRQPRVLRIGENTQGVFSDVLDRRLPNGWRMVLPNEILVDAAGAGYDVTGVPPDIAMPSFSQADIAAQKDSALQKAIDILRESSDSSKDPALQRR